MKRYLSSLVVAILFCSPVFAKFQTILTPCYDCFNFVAPTVSGAETITSPQIGLIVADSYYGGFRGLNSSGAWVKLSNDLGVRTLTSTGTLGITDDVIKADATSAAITVNLPSAATAPGKMFTVKKIDSSANAITVDPYSTETIDGASTKVIYFQNDILKIVSDGTNWQNISQKVLKAPTIQKFTSSSGTYTTAAGVVYIRVRMVGAGGGGGGGGASGGGTGGSGGNTTFGSSFLTANGGSGGLWASGAGAGGSATIGSGATGSIFVGGGGGAFSTQAGVNMVAGGPAGGSSMFSGGANSSSYTAGNSASANTGGGGGGAGTGNLTGNASGGGGGAGGGIDAIIASPSSSYSYGIGSGGSGGSAGSSGYAGGAGGSGYIEVTEYYQ